MAKASDVVIPPDVTTPALEFVVQEEMSIAASM